MFDVARFTTIATSKGKVVLHVNYLFRSYIIKNIFKNVLDEVIMRWHLKGAVLPVGPRYMYICISVLARRLMEYTIESCVLYMYDIPVCPIQNGSSPIKTSTKRHRNTARNRKYQYSQSKEEVDNVPL